MIGRLHYPGSHAPSWLCLIALGACASGTGEGLQPIPDQLVFVGDELGVDLFASDAVKDPVTFEVFAQTIPDIDQHSTIIEDGANGVGLFVFTPVAHHVGVHNVEFLMSEQGGGEIDREWVTIEVSGGDDTVPMFVAPIGGGDHDVKAMPEVQIHVEVRDSDNPDDVVITSPSVIDGQLEDAELLWDQGDPLKARLVWRPSDAEVILRNHTLFFQADDQNGHVVTHEYKATLKRGNDTGCRAALLDSSAVQIVEPGRQEVDGVTGFPVRVSLNDMRDDTDEVQVAQDTVLYWSTSRPLDTEEPDLSQFHRLRLTREPGNVWTGKIPSNPDGMTKGRLYLVASAVFEDEDAAGAPCNARIDSELHDFVADSEGAAGSSCRSAMECAGEQSCLQSQDGGWPGGYCARAFCGSSSQCAPGTWCVRRDQVEGSPGNLCLLDCSSGNDSVCRSGYRCSTVYSAESFPQRVCLSGELGLPFL